MCIRDRNQVSGSDSVGSNDDTFTNNNASSSVVEIKNDKVGDVNTSDNQKADTLNANQATVDKVSSNANHDEEIINKDKIMVNNNNKVADNEVFMHDMVNSRNNDESRKLFGVSNGVALSVYELEREYKDSLNVECEQRAKFSRDVGLSLIHI